MVVGLHEVIDREVVLAVKAVSSTADGLLELDHRVDDAHQYDVSHFAGVHAG
jgi:hypothetical protein